MIIQMKNQMTLDIQPIFNIKKQHQAELEHHGKIIDDLQMEVAEKEKMIETMSDEIKKIKKVTKLKGVKK